MKPLESVTCFFTGHDTEEIRYDTYHKKVGAKFVLRTVARYYCSRCDGLRYEDFDALPPPTKQHVADVFLRLSAADQSDLYYGTCICGWRSEDTTNKAIASSYRVQHLFNHNILECEDEPEGTYNEYIGS